MPRLTEPQERCCGTLIHYAGLRDPRPSVLVFGATGVGKRAVARLVAARLGLPFVDVTVAGDPRRVREHLFGSSAESAQVGAGAAGPGDLGVSNPSMLFLSNLDQLHGDLVNDLHRALTRRIYMDGAGMRRAVSDEVWILGGLTIRPRHSAQIGLEHWLLTAFDFRVHLSDLAGDADLSTLVLSSLEDLNSIRIVSSNVTKLLVSLPRIPGNCRSVRHWIETAVMSTPKADALSAEAIEAAMKADLRWLLPQIPYRGAEISLELVDRWAGQFPDELRATAIYLLGLIAERYYIGLAQYHRILQRFIDQTGLPARSEVVFCKWQHMGKSAERVAHTLRNQADWTVAHEIDLSKPASEWPTFEKPQHFIVADDFVGSGDSLKRIVERPDKLPYLLMQHPESDLRVFLVAGFERAIRRLQQGLSTFGNRVQMTVDVIYDEGDRCFTDNSAILTDPGTREMLRRHSAQRFLSLGPNMRLGYKKIGGLCVFFDTVPNNTLPALWCERGNWLPLFPASGLGRQDADPDGAQVASRRSVGERAAPVVLPAREDLRSSS
jgi:Sigma-54 interaction domain